MLLSRDIRHSYKKYPILFSPLTTGEMILSGGKDGMVAVSSPRTGMTVRILADHKGSAITVLQCTRKQVGTCLCVPALRGSEFPVLWEGAAAWLGRLSHSALGPAPPVTSVGLFLGVASVEESHVHCKLPGRVGNLWWLLQTRCAWMACTMGPPRAASLEGSPCPQ